MSPLLFTASKYSLRPLFLYPHTQNPPQKTKSLCKGTLSLYIRHSNGTLQETL